MVVCLGLRLLHGLVVWVFFCGFVCVVSGGLPWLAILLLSGVGGLNGLRCNFGLVFGLFPWVLCCGGAGFCCLVWLSGGFVFVVSCSCWVCGYRGELL